MSTNLYDLVAPGSGVLYAPSSSTTHSVLQNLAGITDCNACGSCCLGPIKKSPSDGKKLRLDWSSEIGPNSVLQCVEYQVCRADGTAVAEDEFGVTHLSTSPAMQPRRGAQAGPFSMARVWGGCDKTQYKVYARACYTECGHSFAHLVCIDVTVESCD